MKASRCSYWVLIWLTLTANAFVLSQPTDEIFSRHYSMRDGFSHDIIMCSLQDSRGFLWMGTANGLNKFDGYQFTSYFHNPRDTNSLRQNVLHSNMLEDQFQRLWIGSYSGLDILDLKTERFHPLIFDSVLVANPGRKEVKPGIHVKKVRQRKDGKIWICTARGIYLADPSTLAVSKLNTFSQDYGDSASRGDNFLSGHFNDIAETRDGSVWAASTHGLIYWDAATDKTTRYQHDAHDLTSLSTNFITHIYIDGQDQVWIGTFNSFALFNPKDESFTHFLPEQLRSVKPIGDRFQIFEISESKEGKILVGSSAGLFAFNPKTQSFELLLQQFIWSISKDRQGNFWVGTTTGVYQIASLPNKFRVIPRPEDRGELLALMDAPGYSGSSFPGPNFLGIIPDERGGGWWLSNQRLLRFPSPPYPPITVNLTLRPLTLYKDSEGKIWVGGRKGMEIYDPKADTFQRFPTFPSVRVSSFCEEPGKYMWIGTEIGLYRYNLSSGKTELFQHDPDDPQSLPHNAVNVIVVDDRGNKWLGTRAGLSQLLPETQDQAPKFRVWNSTNSGLPYNHINGIVDGGDGTIWLSCGNQISHFFPQTGLFQNYDHHDGLHGSHLTGGIRSPNGNIYFGDRNNTIVVFHPDSLKYNTYVPPIVITDFSIQNNPLPIQGSFSDTLSGDTPLSQSISYTEQLKLTYQQNDFAVEFAALNYINPENNQYKYRLEPYETQWIDASASNRVARYTNISPGEYTFRVIGSNNDGIWNEEGTSLQLIILPPWWQTNWAYALYILLGIVLLYMLRQFTIRRERLKHALELQTMEAEKMHELDHLKSRFFANISHEFRTPLTLILGPLDNFIQHSKEDTSAQSTYRMMQRNARRLLRLVNQLLDLSKLESGNMRLDLKPQPIVPFLKSIALSFASLAERRQITYQFQFPSGNPVVYYDADKLEKIVSNLLSNAFKFSLDSGQVRVGIKLEQAAHSTQQRTLELKVQDSGPGIPAEITEHIFDRFYQAESTLADEQPGSGIGLSLVRELVELHQGEISVENTPGSGACFRVSMPVEVADYEESSLSEANVPPSPSSIETETDEALVEQYNQPEQDQSKPLVLVVEDNADVRTFIRETLQPKYRVQEAPNGFTGLQLALEAIPDLIVSDVMMPSMDMPEMDGVTLSQKLKADERTSHIPIILLTAKASGADKITGLETGADDYMIKPFQSDELLARIHNLIENRRMLRKRYSQEITLQPTAVTVTSVDQQFLERMRNIVESHLADATFGVEAFSEEARLSRVQLFRKLKALTDLSPSEFIKTMRLKRAADLLAQGAGTVGDVAHQVGFPDPSYFTKAFQKQYGQTPSEYHPSSIS